MSQHSWNCVGTLVGGVQGAGPRVWRIRCVHGAPVHRAGVRRRHRARPLRPHARQVVPRVAHRGRHHPARPHLPVSGRACPLAPSLFADDAPVQLAASSSLACPLAPSLFAHSAPVHTRCLLLARLPARPLTVCSWCTRPGRRMRQVCTGTLVDYEQMVRLS